MFTEKLIAYYYTMYVTWYNGFIKKIDENVPASCSGHLVINQLIISAIDAMPIVLYLNSFDFCK